MSKSLSRLKISINSASGFISIWYSCLCRLGGPSSKSLCEYGEGYQREIYLKAGNSEARQKYEYYKIKPVKVKGRIKKFSTRPDRLDLPKYKESCWTCIEPIIEAYGFDVQDLREKILDGRKINIHISTDQPI